MEKTLLRPLSLKPLLIPPPSTSPHPIFSLYPQFPHRLSSTCNYPRRDLNATARADDEDGEFRPNLRRRRRRRRLSDVYTSSETDDGVLQELVDSIWIFKVFRFYGWWLPPVLISMILATGPKAFLLSLALPIGLSIFFLGFSKLWALVPKCGSRANQRAPRGRTKSNMKRDEEEEEEEEEERVRKSDKGKEYSSGFKGWDELDKGKEFDEGSTRRRDVREGRWRGGRRFIRREKGGEMPLLLRLLFAVFPFLGSWTKML